MTSKYQAGDEYNRNSNAIWTISPINSYSCSNESKGNAPYDVVFTKKCTVIDDGDGNFRIKFLETGVLTVKDDLLIDVFLVGGGGKGGGYSGGGGGGSAYVNSQSGGYGGSGIVVIRNKR